MKIDWKIKGWNLLKFGCSKDSVIHPETCSDVVMLGHNNSLSLSNWITEDSTKKMKNSLSEWLAEYYASATLAIAANDETDSQQQIIHHAGIIYPSEGLTVIDEAGGLSLTKATSDTLGGIKLGYTDTDSTRGVHLDSSGNAFVSIDNISTDNYLQDWNGIITTQSPRVYFNNDDSLGKLDLSTYLTNFKDYYKGIGTPDWQRMYPVRTDTEGRLYTYVNWEDTTYYAFGGTVAGLVPNANSVTAKSTKFLNANGDWATPTNTTYGVFSSSTNGLVPKSTNSAAYLQGNGTWTVPQNTTYEVATPAVNQGLLQLNPEISESDAALADNSEATSEFTDLFIPVVANSEIAKCHGVSLKLIVDTIINTPEILTALRDALNPSNT